MLHAGTQRSMLRLMPGRGRRQPVPQAALASMLVGNTEHVAGAQGLTGCGQMAPTALDRQPEGGVTGSAREARTGVATG